MTGKEHETEMQLLKHILLWVFEKKKGFFAKIILFLSFPNQQNQRKIFDSFTSFFLKLYVSVSLQAFKIQTKRIRIN